MSRRYKSTKPKRIPFRRTKEGRENIIVKRGLRKKQNKKMISNRMAWKSMGCKEYICPTCKRNKGMIYLFLDGTLRYVCFCGTNISIDWIRKEYNFNKKSFLIKSKEKAKNKGDLPL